MIVMEVYIGNGRPTGHVCLESHHYDSESMGWYVGEHCSHSATTWAEIESEDAAWAAFCAGEHLEIGHPEPVEGCPMCEVRS